MASGQMKGTGRVRPSRASGSDEVAMPKAANREKIMDKILSLEQEMARTKKRMDNATNAVAKQTATSAYDRLTKSHDKAMAQYDSLSNESSKSPGRAPKLTDSGRVNAPPRPRSEREGKELASNAAERRAGSGSSRPSTVDTRSKKPIAKRIMEALGDKRTMEQATKDREMNQEMEREMMGRKKGGMAKKKKAPVKKAYGGMVKKKQGGSANKVNMKAGFTRRGCSKG